MLASQTSSFLGYREKEMLMQEQGNVQEMNKQVVEAQVAVLKAITPLILEMSTVVRQTIFIGNPDLQRDLRTMLESYASSHMEMVPMVVYLGDIIGSVAHAVCFRDPMCLGGVEAWCRANRKKLANRRDATCIADSFRSAQLKEALPLAILGGVCGEGVEVVVTYLASNVATRGFLMMEQEIRSGGTWDPRWWFLVKDIG